MLGWIANLHLLRGRHIASSDCCCELCISKTCFSGGSASEGTVGISNLLPLLSAFPHLDLVPELVQSIPESISTSKFHFVPRASIVSRRLHCSPGGSPQTDLHLIKACFVTTRCSSDDASRHHQQPLIDLFVSLAARAS